VNAILVQNRGAIILRDILRKLHGLFSRFRGTVEDEQLPIVHIDQNTPWNCFVNYVTSHDLQVIDSDILPSFLVFWYMNEVENGGHLQYFLNRADDPIDETINALQDMGAQQFSQIFQAAHNLWQSKTKREILSVEQYIAEALELEFEELDKAFYAAQPSLSIVLEANLPRHFTSEK
jgi:hypothetical protein